MSDACVTHLDVKLSKNKKFTLPKVVGPGGLEPPTPALSTRCSNQLSYGPNENSLPNGGADRDRTDDLLNANQALFQLSYGPVKWLSPIVRSMN